MFNDLKFREISKMTSPVVQASGNGNSLVVQAPVSFSMIESLLTPPWCLHHWGVVTPQGLHHWGVVLLISLNLKSFKQLFFTFPASQIPYSSITEES
jgi:hypothetical protein